MRLKFSLIIFLLVVLSIVINVAHAKQSDEFINFLSNKIYSDCNGKGLIIKEDSLLDFRNGGSFKTINQEVIKNYDVVFIKEILEIFDSREKFSHFTIIQEEKKFVDMMVPVASFPLSDGTIKEIKFDGRDILRCNDHILDINGTDYYWDNEKIVLPRNNFILFGINFISKGGMTFVGISLFGFFALSIIVIKIIKKYSYLISNKIKIKIFNKKNKCK